MPSDFYFLHSVQTLLRPTLSPVQVIPVALFRRMDGGVKRPGHEDDNSHPFSLKMLGAMPPLLHRSTILLFM
jgi:hypothetical protein